MQKGATVRSASLGRPEVRRARPRTVPGGSGKAEQRSGGRPREGWLSVGKLSPHPS